MEQFLNIIGQIGFVLVFSPLFMGIIAKTKALFAGRRGIPMLQVYYDIAKLLRKGMVYSTTTTWIFQAGPVVFFAVTVSAALVIPLGSLPVPVSFLGDMVMFAYLLGLAKFFMVIAALDTGSSFEGMGASREMAFSCIAEVVLFLDFVVLGLLSGHFMIADMVAGDIVSYSKISGPALSMVGISYFIVLLAENARIPVDDPETHLELTMIHEVMVLDHSGWDLAYIVYGSAVKLFVFCAFLVMMFMPYTQMSAVTQNIFFAGGMIAVAILIGIIESVMARLRLNHVPQLLISAFVIALIALLVVLVKLR
jgi:formate hydrogenlyase subunit 4